ncbi:hypothetical protein WSM22_21650 [Cytophagales bacterium WSM2-2]|nr:hypothetical protein WSM22_21650 [Cytophagales bacterium WSM2-2]
MLQLVKSLDDQFSIGVKTRDLTLLTNIYSDSARYVAANREVFVGKKKIGEDWAEFLKLNTVDLILNINYVSGTREVIYETGTGYTQYDDSTKWDFNYVNVWRLQKNGSYKLEVDTYMPRFRKKI